MRHLFGQEPKPEETTQDLKLGTGVGDHSYIKGNTKFFAAAAKGGGGCMYVLPLTTQGKIPSGTPLVNGHTSNVLDFDFNPFHEHIIASTSDDTTVKVWGIPDGGLTGDLSSPLVNLTHHSKKTTFCLFHPTASNVLATASADQTVKIFDIEAGDEKFSGVVPELIQELKWNNDGRLLVATSKDKNIHIFDPRASVKASHVFEGHTGVKTTKVCFLGGDNSFVSVGFSKNNKRQFKVWDMRSLDKEKTTEDIDSAAGVLLPFYDDAIKVLYLAGKGDGNIRFFEMVDEAPYAYSTGEYRSTKAQKGVAMLPKRGNNVMNCEVTAFLKLHSDRVERIGMTIPRKSDKFQDDIFPDAPAGVASCTSDAWWAGANPAPILMSLNPANNSSSAASNSVRSSFAKIKSASELQTELDAANKRITELEAELARLRK